MASRRPKQDRSKRLTGDILEASALIFEKINFESVTTNKVAQLAGVSIGSLYQYFSNKQDLFSKTIDSQLEKNREKLRQILKEETTTDFEEFVTHFVEKFIGHLLTQKGYLKALIAFQFQLSKSQLIINSRWKMAEIISDDLMERFDWFEDKSKLQKKIFYLINSGFGIVYLYSQSDSNTYMTPEEMKKEMIFNIVSSLKK